MNFLTDMFTWFTDPVQWQGPNSIPIRTAEHLWYSLLAVLISMLIAVPIGLYIGHTKRGQAVVVALAGVLRALPTLGIATLFALLAGLGLMPFIWALVLLAVPPILTSTYAGVANVRAELVQSAKALGMTEWQILTKVEIPVAMPVMLGGLRSAVLQVIATTTIVAVINLGGLGRYIIDGIASNDFTRVLAGGLLVSVLAIVVDVLLAWLARIVISKGLRQTSAKPTKVVARGTQQ